MDNTVENLINDGSLRVRTVNVNRPDGSGVTDLRLTKELEVGTMRLRPVTLCRMCLVRLPISATAKVVLSFILDIEETGGQRIYSYGDIGDIVGRCDHSAEMTVAALRQHGLVTTTRVGRSGATLAFSCAPFIGWAEELLRTAAMRAAHMPDLVPAYDTPVMTAPVQAIMVDMTKPSIICDDKPKRKRPAAKKERVPAAGDQPVPNAGTHSDIMMMLAAYDGEFDNTAEVADTLRAAGRDVNASDDDEDDFSLGSDTAETDIGHDVRINPNI